MNYSQNHKNNWHQHDKRKLKMFDPFIDVSPSKKIMINRVDIWLKVIRLFIDEDCSHRTIKWVCGALETFIEKPELLYKIWKKHNDITNEDPYLITNNRTSIHDEDFDLTKYLSEMREVANELQT